ncbi:MAG: L,D-transpeptidase family protein [Planctomycetota bacterium]|nr:L,D-transpeptidase family protein [Planctomycetota bacterium]
MQTIKTAVVVVLLLVVLYGAYIAINGGTTDLPPELQAMLDSEANLDVDVSAPGSSPFSASANSDSFSSGFSGNAGLKPSAAPSFPGPSPTFGAPISTNSTSSSGSLAPPQLTTLPSIKPLEVTPPQAPKTTDSAAPFGLNTTSNPAKPPVELNSPPTFAMPVKTVANDNQFAESTLPSIGSDTPANTTPSEIAQPSKSTLTGRSYETAKQTALEQINRSEIKEALATLSVFYGSPELSEAQTRDLIDLLDSLAGETIYSRRHLLDTPYVLGPGETIEMVAKRFEIPTELLARINAIEVTSSITPGTKLKVFQGPFRAEVDIKKNEMTVFLGELYAGRFPISAGADPVPKEGVFQVLDKQRNRNYYGLGGTQIDGQDPRNPYGGWWIDLGQDVSIHGTATSGGAENAKLGCISLSPLDAGDVFSMLSRGSQVTIKR